MEKKTPSPLAENKMGVMPIPRLLLTMALPMIASMLVQALYNVVDSIFVARVSVDGVSGVYITALSLAFPVQNIQIGLATGIAVGVNALLSKSLGQKDAEQADRAAGNGILLALVAVVFVMLFGIFCSESYYRLLSEVELTVAGGTAYTTICCTCTLGVFIEVLFERILQSSGRTVYTMITQGTGAILNIILDPVLIFGVEALGIPAFGVAGAAIATVIGQWVAALLAVIFNLRCNPDFHFKLKNLLPRKQTVVPILTVGVPSVVMMAIGSVMNFSMNVILQGIDPSETAAGVFGIYYKLQSFFFMPVFGLNNATISIAAYNYGARQPKRITGVLKCACLIAVAIMCVGTLTFECIPDVLLGLFDLSPDFLSMGETCLRIVGIHFPIAAVAIALGASFQALGVGLYSTITSLCRQMLVLLPVAYLLSLTGEVANVWWAFPIAEVVSLLVTLLFFRRIYNRKIRPLM
ncbi:MAG: MATE family efflux transporter [Firmicutes bacterium]|nr:MATE family efflux transporter [Bacillota bacterium]